MPFQLSSGVSLGAEGVGVLVVGAGRVIDGDLKIIAITMVDGGETLLSLGHCLTTAKGIPV